MIEGDRIVVVKGVRQPLVLKDSAKPEREQGFGCGVLNLVGCCYVHGFMGEEAFRYDERLAEERYFVV